jgi:RND family efflux transporter MFP subunit
MAAAALAVLAFGGGWLTFSLYRGTAPHYITQKLDRGPVVRTVTAYGVLGPAATAPVLARVSGLIQAVYCDVNMKVTAGQLCAKIDPRPYQNLADQDKARLAAAEAQLEKHKANLAQAQATFEPHEVLAKRRAMSRKALDTSRKAYERALARTKRDEAKIAQRQAALHAAEVNLGSTNIVSPVDGTVVSRDANIGQPVAAGPETPPLFLIDPAVIHINANACGQDIGEIKPSSKVTFTIEAFPERSSSMICTRRSRGILIGSINLQLNHESRALWDIRLPP